MPQNIAPQQVEIWFQDEARIGEQGTTTRLWAVKGSRPRALKQGQFTSAYIFAAVAPASSRHAAVILPAVNTEAMQIHLDEISKQVSEGKHAVLVVDRAGWHKAKDLKMPLNISLLYLPPYSPELNPVEQIWDYLRQHFFANRAFNGYEDIIDACVEAWQEFVATTGLIKSMCSRVWASINA